MPISRKQFEAGEVEALKHLKLGIVGLLVLALACASPGAKPTPARNLPDWLESSSQELKDMYAFALARPEILSFIPCYCGCADTGDRSNRDCYIQKVQAGGAIVYSNHAYG